MSVQCREALKKKIFLIVNLIMTSHPLNEMATVRVLYDCTTVRLLGNMSCGHHPFPDKRQHLQDPGVCVLGFFLSERHSSNHPSIWLLLVSDQRFLILLNSVSLLLSATRSFEKHIPPPLTLPQLM